MKSKDLDMRFIVATVAAFVFAMLFFYILLTGSSKAIADPESIKSKIGHMGEVLDYEVIPSTGLTAWKIRPEGLDRQFIFYTTANGKALLTGSIWDAETGTEISSGIKLVQDSMVYNKETGQSSDDSSVDANASQIDGNAIHSSISIDGNGEALGAYSGETPFVINLLDKMKGFKTDKTASATDTVYIFYDPRCPVCNEAYDKIDLIDLKSKNIAVKWMPTTALNGKGDTQFERNSNEEGQKLAAVAIQSDSAEDFRKSMKGTKRADSVSETEVEYLSDNLQVLVAAARESEAYGEDYKIRVPAAMYTNKENGMPKLLFSITDDKALKTIFGE